MNMKRIFALALLVMLLCLPVLAMADDFGTVTGGIKGTDWKLEGNYLEIYRSGLTVSGRGEDMQIYIGSSVNELTLENVTVSSKGAVIFLTYANETESDTCKLIIRGTNMLKGICGIATANRKPQIQMEGNSSLSINAEIPIAAGDDTGTVIPFSAADITSGSGTIIINGEMVYQYPKPSSNDLPQTGDNSNVILWFALACISLFSMMLLIRKRKEV